MPGTPSLHPTPAKVLVGLGLIAHSLIDNKYLDFLEDAAMRLLRYGLQVPVSLISTNTSTG